MVDANYTMAYIGQQFTSPSGLMRGPTTFKNPNKALTRFPAYELLPGGKTEVRDNRGDRATARRQGRGYRGDTATARRQDKR